MKKGLQKNLFKFLNFFALDRGLFRKSVLEIVKGTFSYHLQVPLKWL